MKIGVVGTGRIATLFLATISAIPGIRCTAICTRERSMDRAKALTKEYGIEQTYNDYLLFLENGDFKWVYIGTENNTHFQYGKDALDRHKHVILEKPLAGRLWQVRELHETAVRNQCFLFESMSVRYMPLYHILREQIERLKDIKLVICNFSKVSGAYKNFQNGVVHHNFDIGQYGGALYDLNIYQINFAVSVWGLPTDAQYFPNVGYNGVDTSGVLLLTYPRLQACLIAAKDCTGKNFIQVQGSNGYVYMDGPANAFPRVIASIDGKDLFWEEIRPYQDRLCYELELIHRMYLQKNLDGCRQLFEITLNTFQVIETIVERGKQADE